VSANVPVFLAHATDELVSPNLHVVLLHTPIAMLVAGLLIELFSFLGWRRSTFRLAGRWMILLGALTMAPVATSGLYALRDVVSARLPADAIPQSWNEILQSSSLANDPVAWQHMSRHAWWEAIAAAGLLLVVVMWLACSDRWREKLHVPLLVLLVVGVGVTLAGAYEAGEGVYRHGVAVERAHDGSPTAAPSTSPNSSTPTTAAATNGATNGTSNGTSNAASNAASNGASNGASNSEVSAVLDRVEHVLPPMQIHVISAGTVVSLALAALALAIRATHAHVPVSGQGVDDIAAALTSDSRDEAYLSAEARSTRARFPGIRSDVPPARFWMLAFLLAVLTAAGGWYLLARSSSGAFFDYRYLWAVITNPDQLPEREQNTVFGVPMTRRLAHVIVGSAIVVFTLLLAMCGRWAPRNRGLLLVFAVLLLGALAAQVWLGSLLLFDTNSGLITRFN
jgi:uncharacterized membrane protein